MSVTFEANTLVAAHQGIWDALSAAGAPQVELKDTGGISLAIVPAGAGTVDPATGQLTITWGAAPNGVATGQAATAEVQDNGGTLFFKLTCVQSATPVADSCAMSTLDVVSGAPVTGIQPFTIG